MIVSHKTFGIIPARSGMTPAELMGHALWLTKQKRKMLTLRRRRRVVRAALAARRGDVCGIVRQYARDGAVPTRWSVTLDKVEKRLAEVERLMRHDTEMLWLYDYCVSLIEPAARGEAPFDEWTRAHYNSCAECARSMRLKWMKSWKNIHEWSMRTYKRAMGMTAKRRNLYRFEENLRARYEKSAWIS